LHDVFHHRTRRRLLAVLDGSRRARIDYETVLSALGDGTDEPLRTTLYHLHLPKLARAGVVEWDRDELWIEPGPNYEAATKVRRRLDSGRTRPPEVVSR
jgi:hypothetical protein